MQTLHRESIAAERRSRAVAAAELHRRLTFRPIAISDVDGLDRLFRRLSRESIRFRFFSPLARVPRSALLRLAMVDHERDGAVVALDGDEIVGLAGYNGLPAAGAPGPRDAEIAVTVDDGWHRRGLGRELARRLASIARERGCDAFVVRIMPENRAALGLLRELVPDARLRFSDGEYGGRLALTARAEPVADRVRSYADPLIAR